MILLKTRTFSLVSGESEWKVYVPTHGADTAAFFLRNKPINEDKERRVFPIQVAVSWEFCPFITRFPREDRPIRIRFSGRITKVGRRKDIEDMGHLYLYVSVEMGM
jgi:hypothetical protein